MDSRLARFRRRFLGERPKLLLPFAAPTAAAVVLDLVLRARTIAAFGVRGKFIWLSALLVSAAFWALPLWAIARLRGARVVQALVFFVWVLPLATFCFAGQVLYFRVFRAYMGRDTVRLGIALRGTLTHWLFSWQSPVIACGMLVVGALAAIALGALVRRATAPTPVPLLLVVTFVAAGVCFWTDNVDSRFLQAATPDVCFVHGVVHALRVSITGTGGLHQGFSLRTPAPLPRLASARPRPPNVLVVLTESVRADAMCSRSSPSCDAPFLDAVARDRLPLGLLTAQVPGTFGAWMVLTTGLAPNADFVTAHSAPLLWEVARAIGYRTAYVSAQNMEYENFGAFIERAGIDVLVTSPQLGGIAHEQIGALDEKATAAALEFAKGVSPSTPYFGVVHLSNTHAPYRVDPALQPFSPHSDDPVGDTSAFFAHYKNSARLQERTIAELVKGLQALPSWDDTVVLVLSDHGEQFREHGSLYHLHSLWDEELRIVGFLVAGPHALDDEQRASLATWAGTRTFTEDVHATIVDLFGLEAARPTLPFADRVSGRSLLRERRAAIEPFMLLTTSTSVWEVDGPLFGGMIGPKKVIVTASGEATCIDTIRSPSETRTFGGSSCDSMAERAKAAFPHLASR